MKKEKVAIVWHKAWNDRTQSFSFFRNLLKQKFEVSEVDGLSWTKNKHDNIKQLNSNDFKLIIFCQVLPTATYLSKLNCKNFVWLPMWDGQNGLRLAILKSLFYKKYNLKVICFSKRSYDWLNPFFKCKYFQYFPKPKKQVSFDKPKLLFWERRENMSYPFIRNNLINEDDFDLITIKQTIDIGKPSNIKTTKKIKIINKWLTKKEYAKVLSNHNVFIAPRLKEGIGFSFLEALERGYCVIANNDATMNEYIIDKKTGLLFDYNNPTKLSINKDLIKKIGTNTMNYIKKGHLQWNKQKKYLIQWISK
ncbi:MAG: Glycosyl transferases group 1 [archaeon ADurb.Bin336]|nr:MAG: Glycosyl transferases group 1 [archaeon ADurb.Bin336]